MSSSGCCAGSAVPVSLMAASFAHHQILSLLRMQHGIAMAARRFTLFEAHEPLFAMRSEEHTSELQSLMRISYAVFCLKKKNLVDNIIDIMHSCISLFIYF